MSSVNLADVFVGLASHWRDRTAIVSPQLTLTYSELVARAARSARELRECGIRPGTKVGIATRDNAEIIVLMIASWMLGATAMPIDFRTKAKERAALSSQFGLTALAEDRPAPTAAGYPSILVDESWTDVIGRHDGQPLFHDREAAPALISLTSGTTGRPAGIIIDQETLLYRMIFKSGVVQEAGRMFNVVPLSHAGPRNPALGQLLLGGTLVLHPPMFRAQEFSEAILATNATTAYSVPTMIRDLLRLHGERPEPVFRDLYALVCYGAPILAEEKQRARTVLSRNFVEGYSSGVAGGMTVLRGSDIDHRPESVGRVMPHVTLQVVDDADELLPPGEAGNIRARSPTMARAMYDSQSSGERDRIKDGWAYPGDIGVVDESGFLTLLGRASDVIIRGGVNVHPSEVEAVLSKFPGVRDVAVVGVAAAREGEEIAAFIVSDQGVSEAALTAHCRENLAPDKLPRKFKFVTELPRNPNGKVLRIKLREILEESESA